MRLRLLANMIHRRLFRSPALVAAIFIFAFADLCAAQQLTFTPYKTSGIYAVGEKVGWTVSKVQGTRVDNYAYAIKKNNQVVIKTGMLDLSTGRPSIEVTLDEPAMVYVEISSPAVKRLRLVRLLPQSVCNLRLCVPSISTRSGKAKSKCSGRFPRTRS